MIFIKTLPYVHKNRCIYKNIAEDVETRFDT